MAQVDRREELTDDIREGFGLVLTFADVAKAAKCSVSTARRAFWRGELVGSRFQRGGPVRFTARAVADWIIAGEDRAY